MPRSYLQRKKYIKRKKKQQAAAIISDNKKCGMKAFVTEVYFVKITRQTK